MRAFPEGIRSIMAIDDNLFEKFIDFEKEYSVFNLKYGEIYYWHLIRSWLYRSLLKDDSKYDDLSKKRGNALQVLRKLIVSMINCMINVKQFPLKKNHCDIMFSSSWNFRLVNGEKTDIFFDFLKIDKKYSFKSFEYNDSLHISNQRNISSSFIDLKMMFGYFKFIFQNKFKSQDYPPEIDSIIESLSFSLGTEVSSAKIKSRVLYSICVYNIYYQNILKYLSEITPKAVVMTNAYGLRHFATIRGAKELGIKTVELQHGLIGGYHIDYNFADQIESGRYCPDYLLTFGEYWNETCRSPQSLKKIAIGYRYIEFIEKSSKDVVRDASTVVFYSTRSNDFADFTCGFADLVKEQNYKIVFKYHPMECGKADYPQLRGRDIIVIDQPTEVHNFLTKYEHHVSVGSTVLFEGAMRGVSIYVWDLTGKEHTDILTDSGYGSVVKNEHELFEQIRRAKDNKNIQLRKQLLSSNANENFNKVLEQILNKKG